MPRLLSRLFPQSQSQTPPSTTTHWQRVDPSPSTKLPHPRPTLTLNQRVHIRSVYDAHSKLQQQSLWIRGWKWVPVPDRCHEDEDEEGKDEKEEKGGGKEEKEKGQMRYLLSYTPQGQVYYGDEGEGDLVAAAAAAAARA